MVALTADYEGFRTVRDLLQQRQIGLDDLVRATGVERRVIVAIAHQRYTPSPEQRERVSIALEYPRSRIVWGHTTVAEEFAQARL